MRLPAITVVIPTHDRRERLKDCLDSVAGQTFDDFEVVVVDDASTDGTRALFAGYARSRPGWRLHRHRRRLGAAAARNTGLRLARAPLIAFLDSDDLWHPRKLETQLRFLRSRGATAVYCDFDLVHAGRVVERGCIRSQKLWWYWRDPLDRFTGLRSPRTSTVLASRRALLSVGGFDRNFRYLCDDSDLWYRLCEKYGAGSFLFQKKSLASYRLHDGQLIGANAGLARSFPRTKRGPRTARERETLLDIACLEFKVRNGRQA
jgi:glycosyltransferase involved in cell wall biosynthesis